MYTTCPKCGHQRQAEDRTDKNHCPACGLVFSKYLQGLVAEDYPDLVTSKSSTSASLLSSLGSFLSRRRPQISKSELLAYGLLWLLFVAWGLDFVFMDFQSNEIGRSWFHNVNLVFHEAGHVLFGPFGRTMSILGGSLFQILLPLILMFAFLITNRDGFAASICLWWVGQSMMDIAPYIADARALRLPLLGGGTGADSPGMHDWANLLRPRGWLEYDIGIATFVDTLGSGILLMALAWGAYMLLMYYRETMK